jgi:hypothetical protein
VQKIIAGHNKAFFEGNFLLLLDWSYNRAPVWNFSAQLASVTDDENSTIISISEDVIIGLGEEIYRTNMFFELDRTLLSRDLEIVIAPREIIIAVPGSSRDFGTNPSTGIPGITGAITAILALFVIPVALWGGFLLRRKIIRS